MADLQIASVQIAKIRTAKQIAILRASEAARLASGTREELEKAQAKHDRTVHPPSSASDHMEDCAECEKYGELWVDLSDATQGLPKPRMEDM